MQKLGVGRYQTDAYHYIERAEDQTWRTYCTVDPTGSAPVILWESRRHHTRQAAVAAANEHRRTTCTVQQWPDEPDVGRDHWGENR